MMFFRMAEYGISSRIPPARRNGGPAGGKQVAPGHGALYKAS